MTEKINPTTPEHHAIMQQIIDVNNQHIPDLKKLIELGVTQASPILEQMEEQVKLLNGLRQIYKLPGQ